MSRFRIIESLDKITPLLTRIAQEKLSKLVFIVPEGRTFSTHQEDINIGLPLLLDYLNADRAIRDVAAVQLDMGEKIKIAARDTFGTTKLDACVTSRIDAMNGRVQFVLSLRPR